MAGTNAGQRVVNYLARLQISAPNTPMVDALKVFFEYEPKDPYREHARKLDLLLSQIDIAVEGLRRDGFPDHLYVRQVEPARNAFTASALNAQWSHVTGQVTPEVKLAFDWIAYALPDQKDDVDKVALASLLEALNDIANDELLDSLPLAWKELVERHISAILGALSEQPITGSGPVERAVKDLVTDLVVHGDELEAAPVADEAKAYLKKALGVIGKTVDVAVKSEKILTSIEKLYKLASDKGPLLLELFKTT